MHPVAGHSKLDRSEWISIAVLVGAAVSLFVFGRFLSAVFLVLTSSLFWTRSHRAQAARGKPSFSDTGRYLTAAVTVVLAIVMWPRWGTPSANEAAPTDTVQLSRSSALEPCQEAITPQLSHPSTADFDIFDTSFTEDEFGATFTIGLTAKNTFNLEARLRAICRFEGGKLVNAKVQET